MKRLDLKEILDAVIGLGHKPLFDKPVTNRDFVECECKIHGVFKVKVANLLKAYRSQKGNGCRKCADMTKYKIEDIYSKFYELDLTPKFTEYHNSMEKLAYICNKHPELGLQYTTFHSLKKQHQVKPCKKCLSEHFSKIHTKPFITKRIDDPKRRTTLYKKWRKLILKIFHNSCARCGSQVSLRIHHIIPVFVNPDKIINTNNGVVLCEKCHKEYHKRFNVKDLSINHEIEFDNFLQELKYIPNWLIKNNTKIEEKTW